MIGLLLLLQASQTVPPAPARVASYRETITLLPGGGRAIALEVRLRGAGAVSLPLAWRLPDSQPVSISPAGQAVLVRGPGSPRVEFRAESPDATVRLAFRDDRGTDLHYRLVNGTETEIDSFRLEVSLAPGRVASSVRSSVPAADSVPGRHVMRLQRTEGTRAVRLDAGRLAPGDIVELSLDTEAEARSPIPLVAGVLIALVFLIRRRGSLRHPA